MKISEAARFPTKHGDFEVRIVEDEEGREHAVVYKGPIADGEDIPVRVHSECLTSEVFDCLRCDCNDQLEASLRYFESAGMGVLIYLRQEGRGIGLFNKIRAYALQDQGFDTVEANEQLGLPIDMRRYEVAAAIIECLKIKSIQLLTNNPLKICALLEYGIEITQRVPIHVESTAVNHSYIETKRTRMHHLS